MLAAYRLMAQRMDILRAWIIHYTWSVTEARMEDQINWNWHSVSGRYRYYHPGVTDAGEKKRIPVCCSICRRWVYERRWLST